MLGADALAVTDGPELVYKRSLLQPALGLACLERNQSIFYHSARIMWDSVADATGRQEEPVCVNTLSFQSSVRSIVKITSGEDTAPPDIERMANLFDQFMAGLFVLPFMSKAKTGLQSSVELRKIFVKLLRNRLQDSSKTIETLRRTDEKDWMQVTRKGLIRGDVDLLSVMCPASGMPVGDRAQYDDTELESLSSLLLSTWLAGAFTTPSVILTAVLKLGLDEDLRKRLQDEQESIIACHEGKRDITFPQTCSEMPLLASLIEEVLRFYPPVPISYRKQTCDCVILGFRIPRETIISMDIFAAHRDNKYYENARAFVPDRFAASGTAEVNKITPIISFLDGGHHACIGSALARVSAATTIATLLRYYDFTLDPSQSREILRTPPVQPKSGVQFLTCKRRH